MSNAAKHFDPQLGIDVHMYSMPPAPLPTPHLGFVFDLFDYLSVLGNVSNKGVVGFIVALGSTVKVNGLHKATAGTGGVDLHIPLGVFSPLPKMPAGPQWDDELFMGSKTVLADGDPFSRLAMPVLDCNLVGLIPPVRFRKAKKINLSLTLPTAVNVAIAGNVLVGGPPTVSWTALAFKGGFAALGGLKKLGKFANSKFNLGGKFKALRQRLFGNLPPGFLKCNVLRAEPVDIRDGSVSVEQVDFELPGRLPLRWSRHYRGGRDESGLCGPQWQTPADIRLEREADGVVLFHHPEQMALFPQPPQAPGLEHAVRELQDGARLFDLGNKYWAVQTKDGMRYVFPAVEWIGTQRLARIEDRCGNAWSCAYEQGVLQQLVELDAQGGMGRVIRLQHAAGRLARMDLHDGERAPGQTLVAYRYADGRLDAAVDPLSAARTFAYDAQGRMVRHTDRTGLSFHYAYDAQGRVEHAWGDGGWYDYRFSYDTLLNQTQITDSRGGVSQVTFDENGLPICELDPLDGLTAFEYDAVGRTTAVTDPAGLRTEFSYDDHGNLLQLTRPDGSTVRYAYDADDQPVEVTDPGGGQWLQAYTAQGRLSEQTDPLGATTRYDWDARGQLTACTDARGATTRLGHDRHGQLARITDPLGVTTQFVHDLHGRLTEQTDALGQTTAYDHDIKGRLLRIRHGDGRSVQCAYDAEDQLIEHIDEAGARTQLSYVGIGQLAKRIAPDGSAVQYHYDTEEQLVGVTNERGERYRLNRDALGRIVEEVDYWGQSRTYAYDTAGRLTAATDPLGRRIEYSSDALGRIVRKALPDPEHPDQTVYEQFGYSALGLLESTSNRYRQVKRTFDAAGHLLSEDQDGFAFAYAYDETGNRISRESSAGHRIRYGYDLRGQVNEIAIDEDAPIRIERDALGRATTEHLSETVQRSFAYESARGLLTAQQVSTDAGPLFATEYGYDRAGNLTERKDSQHGTDRYRYDVLGHVLEHVDPKGRIAKYLHDPAGDRLQTRINHVQARKTANGADEPEQWTREGQYAHMDYVFDRAGNLIRRGPEGHPRLAMQFTWDANQRLVKSERTGEAATTYAYDPLGRRIHKRNGTHTTWFYWDGDALAAEVTHANDDMNAPALTIAHAMDAVNVNKRRKQLQTLAERAQEYVYYPGTFVPLALLAQKKNDGSEASEGGEPSRTYYYHIDPNGCPTRLTDRYGTVAWSVGYETWGRINAVHAEVITNPLRYQGQYYDDETGLHYNRHRYFDPCSGQFIGPDPIGLDGGLNVYAYAQNPIAWADPLGLSPSQQLAAAMAKNKNPVPGGYAAHHLIPTNVANRSNLIQEAVKRGIYSPNGASNGLALPRTAAESIASGKPRHSGGHLSAYYEAARTRLLKAEQKLGDLSTASDGRLLAKIRAVERSMRMSLAADTLRLQSTDPRPSGTRSSC